VIYLFSQIAISLALAAIVGGAAGWLAHRARATKQITQLGSLISRQQQQVSEAQTQVSLLTGDFDDLKQHSEAEISTLKLDNQKIPALNQNLEKSQLLVRQLMQQHKAESAELVLENEKLTAKAKLVNDREQAFTKLQAELDIERRRNQSIISESADAQESDDTADTKSVVTEISSPAIESQSELPPNAEIDIKSDSHAYHASDDKNVQASESINGHNSSTNADHKKNDVVVPTAAETEIELKLLRDQLAEDIPLKETTFAKHSQSNDRRYNLSETTVDDAHLEPLFDTVAQHDDLKQIFGIGPVTEKTLNKLGITAYSQLAELKQHDIEKIADALQIFPGRIERDNWVGGARSQLEEVLENL